MTISLSEDYSFKKLKSGEVVYFKGNLLYNNQHISVVSDFLNLSSDNDLINFINLNISNFRGHFSIIVSEISKVIIFSDVSRTYPVFYRNDFRDCMAISDRIESLLKKNDLIDDHSVNDFLSCGFCLKETTLFNGINQTEACQIIEISGNNNIYKNYYFTYENSNFYNLSRVELKKIYTSIVNQIINNIKLRVNSSQVVVPLSGGYDSRFLLTLLLDSGIKNIICFTYGSKSSYEVYTALNICKRLNLKLHFIDYDKSFIKDNLNFNEFRDYEFFAGNYCTLPHVQDFLSVKYLKVNNLIDENAIFMPGIAGDVFAGSQIPSYYNDQMKFDELDFKEKFLSFPDHFYKKKINFKMLNHTSIEQFTVSEKVPKFVANSIRVYEYFNFNFFLPLWDLSLISFYAKIPSFYKNVNQSSFSIDNNLYLNFAFDSFKKYNISFRKDDKFIFILRGFSYLQRKLNLKQDSVNNFDIIINNLEQLYKCKTGFKDHKNVNLALSKIYLKILDERY
jgi:asparagine synthase (glutamine-hydrolysing)